MDFVIVGIVIGAAIVGAGALLRDLGPRFRPRITRPNASQLDPNRLASAWARFCQSLGTAVTTLGFLTVLATVVAFFVNVADGTGWVIVGIATIAAAAGTAASAVTISRHYERGGFDPVDHTATMSPGSEELVIPIEPTTVIVADQTVPLDQADPFEIADQQPIPILGEAPVAAGAEPSESKVQSEQVVAPEEAVSMVAEPEPEQALALKVEPTEPLPTDSQFGEEFSLEPIAVPEPIPVGEATEVIPAHADVAPVDEIEREPERGTLIVPATEAWQRPAQAWSEPAAAIPPAEVPVLSGFEPPLIDLDDDLPAWNGPPIEWTPAAPIQYAPSSEVGGVFESSLLADLTPETAPADELTGPFQSRLLNELTASPDEPESPGNDVLIAETPAVDLGRGSRTE